MICFYHNDADGHCAGAIVKKYTDENFPYRRLRFMEVDYAYDNYEEKALKLVELYPDKVVYIVDFHFSAKVVKEMSKYAAEIYVFDHHKSAAETIAQYPKEVVCHCDPESKLAGCELVWEYLFPNDTAYFAVTLIADRDKWAWKYGIKTSQFIEGLQLYPNHPDAKIWESLFMKHLPTVSKTGNVTIHNPVYDPVKEICEQGEICLKYRDNKFKGFREAWGYETMLDGHTCYVINIMFHDAVAELFGDKINEYDICAATVYKNGLWKISFRSNTVDVSKIAQRFGGGGHAGAAGCENLKELPFMDVEKEI